MWLTADPRRGGPHTPRGRPVRDWGLWAHRRQLVLPVSEAKFWGLSSWLLAVVSLEKGEMKHFQLNRLIFTPEVLLHSKWIRSLMKLFLYAQLWMPYVNPLIGCWVPRLSPCAVLTLFSVTLWRWVITMSASTVHLTFHNNQTLHWNNHVEE